MTITESQLLKATQELKSVVGSDRDLAFAYLHLQQKFDVSAEVAKGLLLTGGRGLGATAYYYDRAARNLYLFIHRWGQSLIHLSDPLDLLCQRGFGELFGSPNSTSPGEQLADILMEPGAVGAPLPNMTSLRATLMEQHEAVANVVVALVFNGDVDKAKTSPLWPNFTEEVTSRKHLATEHFGRNVRVLLSLLTVRDGRQVIEVTPDSQRYHLDMEPNLDWATPSGVQMRIGFIRLSTLGQMHKDIGVSFFESNVRAGLAEDEAPNRAITAALREIVLDEKADPQVFAFNHNGVTLSAETITHRDEGGFEVVNPRLLNGAQTVSTFSRFLEKENIRGSHPRLRDLKVIAKVIQSPDDRFTARVTINNNRQNPVMPWDLRANDAIQLKIGEWLLETLGIYYERQANAFEAISKLSDAKRAELRIVADKPVKLVKLASTFLAVDGRVDKMGRMKEAFEDDRIYLDMFNQERTNADARAAVLCYKIDKCLAKLLKDLNENSADGRYAFLYRGRNLVWALLCQAVLNNTKQVERHVAEYGEDLVITQGLRAVLAGYAASKVRPVLNVLVEQEPYEQMMQQEKYGFLSTKAAFDRAMVIAEERYSWKRLGLPKV